MRKIWILFLIFLVSSVIFWYLSLKLMSIGLKMNLVWQAAISLIIFSTSFSLISLFLKEKLLVMLSALLPLISFLLIFRINVFYLLPIGIAWFLIYKSSSSVYKEQEERIKISIKHFLHENLYLFFLAIAILISTFYYFRPEVQALSKGVEIPFDVRELIGRVIITRAKIPLDEGQEIGLEELAAPQKKAEFRNRVVDLAEKQFNTLLKPFFKFLPLAATVLLFLSFEAIGFVFIWLTILFTYLIFLLFKKRGFIKIEKIEKESEVIKLP